MCNTKISGYPSIDKPWLKYYSTEAIHTKPAECTVYQNIYQHNQAHPHDLALEYFGVKITFSKLFAQVESCAKALLHAGVHLGDRVTLCTSGTPERHRADKRWHQCHHRAIRNRFSRGFPPEKVSAHRPHLVFQRHFDLSVDAPLLGSLLHSRTFIQS